MNREKTSTGQRSARQAPSRSATGRHGTVVAHRGVAVEVRFDDGELVMVRVKRRSGHVAGDDVVVRGGALERLPRRTELRRRDAGGGIHLVGANLDVLGVVVSPAPEPPPGFIDRAVVAARSADLLPFLVVNKCDLAEAAPLAAALSAAYGMALRLFVLSVATGEGIERLREFLAEGHRGAFVGTTGVGKSSLLNALCPEIGLRVGALNEYTGKGCHTTTVATLHNLAGGGMLMDTPGFQDFGLVDITPRDLARHFPGFDADGEVQCRFRDCRHRSEPGCAIIGAVADGRIPAGRYKAYRRILDEVEAGMAEPRRRGRPQ